MAKALIASRVSSVVECNADTLDGAKLCDVLRTLGINPLFVDDDPTTVKLKCTWLTALDKVDNPTLCTYCMNYILYEFLTLHLLLEMVVGFH